MSHSIPIQLQTSHKSPALIQFWPLHIVPLLKKKDKKKTHMAPLAQHEGIWSIVRGDLNTREKNFY